MLRVPHIGNRSYIKWWDPHEFSSMWEWMLEKVLDKECS